MAHHFTNDKRMDYLVQLAAGAMAGLQEVDHDCGLSGDDWTWYANRAANIALETLARLENRVNFDKMGVTA